METMYEQTSFLENNDAINATQIDRKQETFTNYNSRKPYHNNDYSRRPFSEKVKEASEAPYNRRPRLNTGADVPYSKRSLQNEAPFVRRSLPNNATEQSEVSFVRRSLPNKAFDQEYMTEWGREVKFLADKGIPYTYVKRTPDYGISQFKYKKTPALFEALKEFYSQVEVERANLASTDEVQEVLKGAGITIQRGRNGSIKFVKDEPESEKPAAEEGVIE